MATIISAHALRDGTAESNTTANLAMVLAGCGQEHSRGNASQRSSDPRPSQTYSSNAAIRRSHGLKTARW
jgi:hypothetical protein